MQQELLGVKKQRRYNERLFEVVNAMYAKIPSDNTVNQEEGTQTSAKVKTARVSWKTGSVLYENVSEHKTLSVRTEDTKNGLDILVEGLPENHVLEHLVTIGPFGAFFVAHKPRNSELKDMKLHARYSREHDLSEFFVTGVERTSKVTVITYYDAQEVQSAKLTFPVSETESGRPIVKFDDGSYWLLDKLV